MAAKAKKGSSHGLKFSCCGIFGLNSLWSGHSVTYNMWTHSGAAKAELLALYSFSFSAVGCTSWVFFRKRILTWSDLGSKESEIEKYSSSRKEWGVWCSFLLQGHNFSLALREVLSSVGPGAGLDLGVSLPTQDICDISLQLHRAPWSRGAKSLRTDLRGSWMFGFFGVFFHLLQDLLDLQE